MPDLYHWDVLANFTNEHGWTRGAELGVRWGQTSRYLLRHCPQLHMIGVDLMAPQPPMSHIGHESWDIDWTHNRNEVAKIERDFGSRFTMLRMMTDDAAKLVEDASLDFVFIDADHSYEAVKSDIEHWRPKVRPGGMITGHDINMPRVKLAVDEMIGEYETRGADWNNIWWAPA